MKTKLYRLKTDPLGRKNVSREEGFEGPWATQRKEMTILQRLKKKLKRK